MSVDMAPPWIAVSQDALREQSRNSKLPLWQRVSFAAYADLQANGHAKFDRGELARRMGKCRQDIDRAIRTAIKYGWLDESSCTECLVPPAIFVEMGFGSKRKTCTVHGSTTDGGCSGRKIKRSSATHVQVEGSESELSASNVNTQCLQTPTFSASNGQNSVLQRGER